MELCFINDAGNKICLYPYPLNEKSILLIKNSLELKIKPGVTYIFSFGRFYEFDVNIHGPAIAYLFDNDTNPIKKKLIRETKMAYFNSYKFSNTKDVLKNLSKDQILFLCGICHQLNLVCFLTPFVKILTDHFGMSFDNIKLHSKDMMYRMLVFTKQYK